MTIYMPYLQSTCASLGIAIKIREGTSLEDIVGHAIEELAGSDPSKIVVINCSGLGARQLCGDAKVCYVRACAATGCSARFLVLTIHGCKRGRFTTS